MIITHSSLEAFKTCRCKYKLRYIDKICPIERKAALEFGSQMHLVLQHLFETIQATQDTDERVSADEIMSQLCQMIDIADMEATDRARLKGLIIGYIKRWYQSDCDEYEVVDVEKEFFIRLFGDGDQRVDLSGKVDGILRRKSDGKYFVLEHKTASVVNDDFVAQKEIDSQTMTYAIAIEQAMGIEVSGAIHDILKKQQIRIKKGETEDEFCQRLMDDVTDDNFTRILIEFSENDLFSFTNELVAVAQDVSECKSFYRCTGQCIGRFGACEYLSLCRARGCLEGLESVYDIRLPHEEISQETLQTEV